MPEHDALHTSNGSTNSTNGTNGGLINNLGLRIKPQGLVIDDNPYPLLNSIKSWIEGTMGPEWTPEWTVHKTARAQGEVDRWVKGKDFVLLDYRLQGQFQGFSSGLDLGQYIVNKHSNVQIFFYTGFQADLKKSGTRNAYRDDFKDFTSHRNVTFFTKGDLVPEKRLNELCYKISVTSERLQAYANSNEAKELRTLLNARVDSIKQCRYRIVDFDLRKARQTLYCTSEPGMGEIEMPTDYLKKAGVKRRNVDIVIKIIEFNGGQVLSYIAECPTSNKELADSVLKYLKDE